MGGLTTIERYRMAPLDSLWSAKHRYEVWATVAAHQAMARYGEEAAAGLLNYRVPTPAEVRDMETTTRHDVVAFLLVWRKQMTPAHRRIVHTGLTSSDLVDTANSVIMVQVTQVILEEAVRLIKRLAQFALDHWDVQRLARTHGQPAEQTTLGYQFAQYAANVMMNTYHLSELVEHVAAVKMSGPIGGFRFTSIDQERKLAGRLGEDFHATEIAGQRIPRENYARWVSELAIYATTLENLVLQIRLGQQFGVEELAEGFGYGQVGSSSMPHKQNPIASETLTGLARVVRAQVAPVMEGIPTWSERDITHSSVERFALETASTLVHFMTLAVRGLVDSMRVNQNRIQDNLLSAGQQVNSASYKAVLVERGALTHEQADAVVAQAIQDRKVGSMLETYLGDACYTAPRMRVGYAREMMEEFVSDDFRLESR